MTSRLAATVVFSCLCTTAAAQTAPNLSRQQRDLLQALVTAVDSSSAHALTSDPAWQIHVMRASDGSHYLAISVTPTAGSLNAEPIAVYVRLATAAAGATTRVERSLVREWLQGSRVDPRMLPKSGMAIGEMPAMGAGAIGARGAGSVGSADLQAMNLQRDRERQRRDDDEKKRRDALEGGAIEPSSVLPFEDFEFGPPAAFADGTTSIQRAITAGPGEYDLYVAWSPASQPARTARVSVARQTLTLTPATPELSLSSVIVADRVGIRTVPYSALEQRAHPYSIGVTEIVPARDTVFTPDERLSAVFQIVNPAPGAGGKPDVLVSLRVARLNGTREEPIASLSPLIYNADSLPADFDVRLGHPLIAALALPLATIPRGTHRLLITAEDRVGKAVVSSRVEFTVTGSAASLLAEAPPLGPKFDPAAALDLSIIATLLDRLSPPMPSPALARALAAARSGRFPDLLIEDRVAADEQALRSVLTGIALLSLGDLGAISQFERAQQSQNDRSAIDYLLGVARAIQGRDAEAIERWTAARAAGLPRHAIDRTLTEALLRRREFAKAAEIMRDVDPVADSATAKALAATRIGERREADAVVVLDALLAKSPDDQDARWMLIHALYAGLASNPTASRERLVTEAQRYIEAKGRHSALATEWLAIMKR